VSDDTEVDGKPAEDLGAGANRSRRPNPRRVAAGKINGPKRDPLCDASLARLRAAALANRPWRFATGPKTVEGRARAASNGRRRHIGPLSVRQARAEIAKVRSMIRAIHDTCMRVHET
jgi:hypothetical protein